jgi:hypothetical protein
LSDSCYIAELCNVFVGGHGSTQHIFHLHGVFFQAGNVVFHFLVSILLIRACLERRFQVAWFQISSEGFLTNLKERLES